MREPESEEEINIRFDFIERRGAVKVPLNSRITINQKWILPDKLLTDVVSDCLKNEVYSETELTAASVERLSQKLKEGNAKIVKADLVDDIEVSPPVSPGIPGEVNE